MADSVRKRWIKTEGGNWSTGLRRDRERLELMWESERGEEAVECIDFFPPSSFLKLIKVLAWFSDYPTAYGDFLLLKGSACRLLLPPLAVPPSPLSPRCLPHRLFT